MITAACIGEKRQPPQYVRVCSEGILAAGIDAASKIVEGGMIDGLASSAVEGGEMEASV